MAEKYCEQKPSGCKKKKQESNGFIKMCYLLQYKTEIY